SDWLRAAPFFVVGFCITAIDLSLYTSQSPASFSYTFPERLLIASRALWFYVGKLLWPAELAVIYPLWDIRLGDAMAWGYAVSAIALAVLLWVSRQRFGRGPFAGAAFFALTLSPVLGFVDHHYMEFSLVADRFQYLAGLGVMAVVIGGVVSAVRWIPSAPVMAARGLVAGILLVLGTLTWLQTGVYRDGVTLFSHIIAVNPEAWSVHNNLADSLIEAGRPEEAVAAAREAVKRQPRMVAPRQNLGAALTMLDRFEEAESTLVEARKMDPQNEEIIHAMGELMRKQGHHEEAIMWYLKAISRDPNYAPAHAGRAVSLLTLNRNDEAAQLLNRFLLRRTDGPMTGDLHLLLGRALRKLGRFDDAVTQFHRSLSIEPRSWRPLLELAYLCRAQNRFDDAEAYRLRIREPARAMFSLHSEGKRLNERGRYEEAAEPYRLALVLDPANAVAQAGMVAALLGLERYEAAIDLLDRSARLRPDTPPTAAWHVLMGLSLQGLGRNAEAVVQYERAVAADPNDKTALALLAGWRFEAARYEEAVALYRRMLAAGKVKAEIHANLGAALYRLGRPDEALRRFEHSLSLDPSLERARAGLQQLQEMSRREVLPGE
ncbi:MAG: tetratricopeptide repeat protein, partial [Candidatus Tectomicrobia bacterium]|nr:tetratricopeptide repeat protein [Candidatus Tectomicrobia bacterium]